MGIKRIVAANMQQGLKIISQELGPDAVILSNKRIAEGVEILASVEDQVESDNVTADIGMSSSVHPPIAELPLERNSEKFRQKAQQAVDDPEAMSELLTSIKNTREKSSQQRKEEESSVVHQQHVDMQVREQSRQDLISMQAEIASLKSLLSKNLNADVQKEKVTSDIEQGMSLQQKELAQRLSKMGFGESYIKELLVGCDDDEPTNNAWAGLLKQISGDCYFGHRQPVTHGGIWAFVGPTGGGKTTTLGKIAAQYVMQNNAESVAIISLDTFRIGAQEQLKVLSNILGVQFYSVTPEKSLQQLLAELSAKKLVLVDTGGCEKGMMLYENQLDACSEYDINNVLVAPATCQGWLLNHWYEKLPISQIDFMAITKIDESPAIGAALSLSHVQNLPLLAWCDGQNIPDDISFSQINRMINSAVSLAKKTNIMKQNDFFAA
jgi:flagellar biosynthesis protein FlhF